MTKTKVLNLIGNLLTIALFCWIGFSILEIGMRDVFAESHEYNSLNFITLMIDLFGGVR